MKKYHVFSVLSLSIVLSTSTAAHASSPAAWEEFRNNVKTKCKSEAAKHNLKKVSAIVDPFGSEQFGFAFITGVNGQDMKTSYTYICVFDKQKETVELSGEWETKKLKLEPVK